MSRLLRDMPVGTKVDVFLSIGIKKYPMVLGDKKGALKLIGEKVLVGALDGKEPSNPNTIYQKSGNPDYALSNAHQWLNSTVKSNWWKKSHAYDTPPSEENLDEYTHSAYEKSAGFLSNVPSNALDYFLENTRNYIYKNTKKSVTSKIYLPAMSELVNSPTLNGEGEKWELFTDDASHRAPALAEGWGNWGYYLRTSFADSSRFVYASGSIGSLAPSMGNGGLRPCVDLPLDARVSDNPDKDGYYTLELPFVESPIKKIFVNTQSGVVKQMKKMYVKTGADSLKEIKAGYVKTGENTLKKIL